MTSLGAHSGLSATEAKSAEAQKPGTERVTLAQIEDAVAHVEYLRPTVNQHVTLCVITLKNSYTVVGLSAPADADNFDDALGREYAYENAVRQIWPLMGFALREKLHKQREAEG